MRPGRARVAPFTKAGISPALALAVGLLTIAKLLTAGNGLFWDSMLYLGAQPLYLYEQGFSTLVLPLELDTGTPPLLYLYFAGLWSLFGKSLWLTHLAVLPALWMAMVQAYRLARAYLSANLLPWGFLLLLADPTFLAQALSPGPDIFLLAFFVWGLNSLRDGQNGQSAIAASLLVLTHARGTFLLLALGLVACWYYYRQGLAFGDWFLPLLKAFGPALLLAAAWHGYHYWQTGWVGYTTNPESPYASARHLVGPLRLLRNLGVVAWRLLDFGRFGLYLVAGVASLLGPWRKFWAHRKSRELLGVWGITLLCLLLLTVPFSNAIGHRYFLPAYWLWSLWAVLALGQALKAWRQQVAALLACCLLLVSGHWWVYPVGIAQGWDASLAHLPFFRHQKQMLAYLDSRPDIPISEVGSDFPLTYPQRQMWLNGDKRAFKQFDLEKDRYLLYTSLSNGTSKQQYEQLRQKGRVVKAFRSCTSEMVLYRLPQNGH